MAKEATAAMSEPKRVYGFGAGAAEGAASMKNLLGGKGANLAEMSNLGLPVPPGFTITTEECVKYLAEGGDFSDALRAVRPKYFTKGGDRVVGQSMPAPEEAVCAEFEIEIIDGVGRDKIWSSTNFLEEWGEFWAAKKQG